MLRTPLRARQTVRHGILDARCRARHGAGALRGPFEQRLRRAGAQRRGEAAVVYHGDRCRARAQHELALERGESGMRHRTGHDSPAPGDGGPAQHLGHDAPFVAKTLAGAAAGPRGDDDGIPSNRRDRGRVEQGADLGGVRRLGEERELLPGERLERRGEERRVERRVLGAMADRFVARSSCRARRPRR